MPKFTPDKNNHPLEEIFKEGRFLTTKKQIREIIQGSEYSLEGNGAEAIVVGKSDKTDEVAAINYSKPTRENLKQQFYIQRILSILFPHNFPKFLAATNPKHEGRGLPGTIRKKIIKTKNKSIEVRYPFSEVENTLSKLGIKINFDFESQNYVINDDGGEYFLDTIKFSEIEGLDIERIIIYMTENKYSSEDIETVKKAYDRFITNT